MCVPRLIHRLLLLELLLLLLLLLSSHSHSRLVLHRLTLPPLLRDEEDLEPPHLLEVAIPHLHLRVIRVVLAIRLQKNAKSARSATSLLITLSAAAAGG